MQLAYRYKPLRFFLNTFLFTWIFWFIASYLSYQKEMIGIQLFFIIFGLLVPFITTLIVLYSSKNNMLRQDFWDRLGFLRIKGTFLALSLFLMPVIVFLATGISLLFGYSSDQFFLTDEFTVVKGSCFFTLLVLFLAPMFEELAWRGYGVDSLRAYFNLFKTTILFACLWALWHLPLFFISGYYHNVLWNTSIIYTINFFVSIFPATILMNWVYYKNNRNIVIAIIFHFILDLFSVCFQTEQFTKCITTILLLLISGIVVMKNKKFFFYHVEDHN